MGAPQLPQWLLLASLVVAAPALSAATVESVAVELEDDRYHIRMQVHMTVPVERAFATFTDFSQLPDINPTVVEVDVPKADLLRTVVESCSLFFCMSIEQTQLVRSDPPERLQLLVLPEISDWRYGRLDYHFQAAGEGASRLRLEAVLEPDFWIPPIIGNWLIRRKLREEAIATSRGIERFAGEGS